METKYDKHKLKNLILVNDIVTIHYLELFKDFDFRAEAHDFWELVYVDKSSVIAMADGKKVVLEEGEILFHKPSEVHSLAANGKTAPNVFIISFACKSKAMSFFEGKKMKPDKNLIRFIYIIAEEGKRTFNLPYFNPNLTKLELLPSPTLGGEQLIKNYLEILLINLMRSQTENSSADIFLRQENASGSLSEMVIDYMKNHIEERLCMNDVCRCANYNKSYIFRTFKKQTGRTVMNYFTRLKIERAKQLLREGKLNVTQISEKLAFDAPDYFTKTFKKITGYSPMKYKKIYLSSPS